MQWNEPPVLAGTCSLIEDLDSKVTGLFHEADTFFLYTVMEFSQHPGTPCYYFFHWPQIRCMAIVSVQ